jgi:hypothetical protein
MKVIDSENLPARLPLWSSITVWLLLDRLQAPGWVYGVMGTLFAIIWIAAIVKFFRQTETKIFNESNK